VFCLVLTLWGAFPLLVLGPVFKTGEGSGNRLLVGSIPMRSRHPIFSASLANVDQIGWTFLTRRK
jgi:hypothetical protein